MRTPLPASWTLRATGGAAPAGLLGVAVAAVVPGCVHTDLLGAGVIPDPYLDEHEAALAWIGRSSWRYATSVNESPAAPGERVELVFDQRSLSGRRRGGPDARSSAEIEAEVGLRI